MDTVPRWYDVFRTKLGWVAVLASQRGLRATSLPQATPEAALEALGAEAHEAVHDPGRLVEVRQRLCASLEGAEAELDAPLDLEGRPPFFRAAWLACRGIPRGETRSYGWLAAAAGRPGAARAAGQAMARNPLPLIIPCHRVVGSSGGLHGFGGGLPMKADLLALEGKAAGAGALRC
ncbi:MAG: methylated-DNA--[protein]-cysteine S-methyltransferase [Chloroflexi bacterium]|nr:methylated-DNA--[protein]-cysteine S-methyltransferase [Chloroflexota bacterium]